VREGEGRGEKGMKREWKKTGGRAEKRKITVRNTY